MTSIYPEPETVKRALRLRYLGARSEQTSKVLDGFAALLAKFYSRPMVITDLAQEAANYIHRQFRLRYVMIGLRNPMDGVFRYEVHAGMRPEAWSWQKTRTYKKEDFSLVVDGYYQAGEVSRLTRVYLEEENPLGEGDVGVVNRPFLLKAKRKSEEDTLEADFIDTLIMDDQGELLGWIEYGGTLTGKFPDTMTIRYIELISVILGVAMTSHSSPGQSHFSAPVNAAVQPAPS